MDDAVAEIDLRPGQKDDLGDAQAVTEGQENRRGIALAPAAALLGGGDQALDLIRSQELARPALGVPAARRWPFRRRGLGLRLLRRREYCSILVVRHVFALQGLRAARARSPPRLFHVGTKMEQSEPGPDHQKWPKARS